jgi:glycosyltransferase involved in cell wall biosynthesis
VELTVVVPAWGRYVAWLRESIDSIWAQRDQLNLRVIVIDNASDEPLPALPDGVEVQRLPQRHTLGTARNLGLELVDTELVSFCDADDVFPPGYFSFAVSRFAGRPKLVAVGMRAVAVLPSGEERPFFWPSDGAIAASRHRRRLAIRNLFRGHSVPMSGSVFRAAALWQAGGYSDLDYSEERNLAMLLPFLGEIEIHPAPGRRYRIHSDTVSRTQRDADTVRAAFADGRRRLRRHPGVPVWAKSLLPLVRIQHARLTGAIVEGAYERQVAALGNARTLEGTG